MKKVIIIGAGPAGLSAAYTLSKNDIDVVVFEASPNIGGMSRSFDLWGQRVDLGPHRFFSKEPKINNFFDEIIKEDYTLVSRLTRIYYKKRFFDYPLKLLNVLSNLSIATIFSILFYYGKQRIFPIRNPETFEKWLLIVLEKSYILFSLNIIQKNYGVYPALKLMPIGLRNE